MVFSWLGIAMDFDTSMQLVDLKLPDISIFLHFVTLKLRNIKKNFNYSVIVSEFLEEFYVKI